MSVSLLYACVGGVYATVMALRYIRVNSANHALCVSKLIANVEHTYVLRSAGIKLLCIHRWIQSQSGKQGITNNNDGKGSQSDGTGQPV